MKTPPEKAVFFGGVGSNPSNQKMPYPRKGMAFLAEMEDLITLWSIRRRAAGCHQSTGLMDSLRFKSLQLEKPYPRKGMAFLAEMEGFEPPHALRRLADFESAPFSHLGTSPFAPLL